MALTAIQRVEECRGYPTPRNIFRSSSRRQSIPQDLSPSEQFSSVPRKSLSCGMQTMQGVYSSKSVHPCKSPQRRVTFETRIRVKEVRHRNDMSPQVIQAIWLTPEDYIEIKENIKKTICMMMAGEIIHEDENGFCTRGLEGRTREGQALRVQRKFACKHAVLGEQENQLYFGTFNADHIAEAASIRSSPCILDARVAALSDARDAKEYLSTGSYR